MVSQKRGLNHECFSSRCFGLFDATGDLAYKKIFRASIGERRASWCTGHGRDLTEPNGYTAGESCIVKKMTRSEI
jgi:hypothetical protein